MKLTTCIILTGTLLGAILIAGCTASTYEHYQKITIQSKFTTGDSIFTYKYFITSSDNSVSRVDKDVYSAVFENHTYILENGRINGIVGESNPIGYISVIKEVSQ